MAVGAGTKNERPFVSIPTWRSVANPEHTKERAEAEAARLIAADEFASKARLALIAANQDVPDYTADLDESCEFALYFYWRIPTRTETERKAPAAALNLRKHLLHVMWWISELNADMPSLFDLPQKESPHVTLDMIMDALERIDELAVLRRTVAKTPDLFGISRQPGLTLEEQDEAARRFAIGHLAHLIVVYDSQHRKHNEHVALIAQALFPGDLVTDRVLDRGRDRAAKFFAAMNALNLLPYPGVLWDV